MKNNKHNNDLISKLKNNKLKHIKPVTDEEFGHYLAGLIDGDGYINNYVIDICFYILDLPLAQYLVSRLGGGFEKLLRLKINKLIICK